MTSALLALLGVLSAPLQPPSRLSLDEAIRLARERNLRILRAQTDAGLARAQAREVLGASLPRLSATGQAFRTNYLPDFSLTGQYAYVPVVELDPATGLPRIDPATGQPVGTPYAVPQPVMTISNNRQADVYTGKLLLTLPVFAGGRIFYGYRAARANEAGAQARIRAADAEVVLEVKRAYLGALLADAVVDAEQEAVGLAKEHLVRVQALFARGVVSNHEVLRAQVQIEGIGPALIQARTGARLTRERLLTLLDLPPAEVVLTDALDYRAEPVDPEALERQAHDARPEILDLRERRTMAEMGRKAARAAFFPQIGLFGQYETNHGGFFPPLDRQWVSGYTAGVSVDFLLFEGLSGEARVAQARAAEEEVGQGLSELEDGVSLEVRRWVGELQAAEQSIAAQERVVDLARRNLDAVTLRYGAGQATHLDVLDAQTELTRARVGLAQARHDALVARAELERSCGR